MTPPLFPSHLSSLSRASTHIHGYYTTSTTLRHAILLLQYSWPLAVLARCYGYARTVDRWCGRLYSRVTEWSARAHVCWCVICFRSFNMFLNICIVYLLSKMFQTSPRPLKLFRVLHCVLYNFIVLIGKEVI